MGSPLSGLDLSIWSRMKELLQLGSWESFFRPSSGCLCVILWSAGLLWSGVGSTFCCLRFWRGLGVYPSSQRRSGFWPSSSGPVASRPPLGIGLLRQPHGDLFHLGVFMRWSSTHGGLLAALPKSRTSRYGLLVYVQGASDSLPHSSPGGEVVASFLAWMSPRRQVRVCPSLPFKDCNSVLKVLVLKCRVLMFSWVLTLSA